MHDRRFLCFPTLHFGPPYSSFGYTLTSTDFKGTKEEVWWIVIAWAKFSDGGWYLIGFFSFQSWVLSFVSLSFSFFFFFLWYSSSYHRHFRVLEFLQDYRILQAKSKSWLNHPYHMKLGNIYEGTCPLYVSFCAYLRKYNIKWFKKQAKQTNNHKAGQETKYPNRDFAEVNKIPNPSTYKSAFSDQKFCHFIVRT